jgi:acyl-homoserine lactone acylase PvdQ
MAQPEQARTVIATGQSGHPASKNSMDQFKLWLSGRLRRHPLSYPHLLKLKPGPRP